MSQEQEQTTSNIVDTIHDYQTIAIPQLSKAEAKRDRLLSIEKEIEAGLQNYITEASLIRQKATGAKTDYKRQYYDKKFRKVNLAVRESVMALQQIKYLLTKADQDDATPTA